MAVQAGSSTDPSAILACAGHGAEAASAGLIAAVAHPGSAPTLRVQGGSRRGK